MSLIDEARKEINDIDKKMLDLFELRMEAVKKVLEYKKKNKLQILDEKRENEIIQKNLEMLNNKSFEEYYLIFLKGVFDSSKKYQGDNL